MTAPAKGMGSRGSSWGQILRRDGFDHAKIWFFAALAGEVKSVFFAPLRKLGKSRAAVQANACPVFSSR